MDLEFVKGETDKNSRTNSKKMNRIVTFVANFSAFTWGVWCIVSTGILSYKGFIYKTADAFLLKLLIITDSLSL